MQAFKLPLALILLAFAEAGPTKDDSEACYNRYVDECFVANNAGTGTCASTIGEMKQMVNCVSGISRCAMSPFHLAIIIGYKRRAMDECQTDHCLTPMQNCMPKTKDLWHQLPPDAQGASDICSELQSPTVKACLGDIKFHCENVKLHGFKQTLAMPFALSTYLNSFCKNNQESCLMTALKQLPASYMSFYETGRSRFLAKCVDRDSVNAAMTAAMKRPQCLDIENIMEYVNVIGTSGEYERICGELCIVEAEVCFENYFGKKANNINCNVDKTALLSCLSSVESTYNCSAIETAEITEIRASVNANC